MVRSNEIAGSGVVDLVSETARALMQNASCHVDDNPRPNFICAVYVSESGESGLI